MLHPHVRLVSSMCDLVCDIVCVCVCVCVCARARVCPQVSSAQLKASLAAARDGLPGVANKDHPLRELRVSEAQDAIELLDNCGLLIRKDGAMMRARKREQERVCV